MIKVALIALFVMSMGTLGLAASGLPVDQSAVAAELR
jgi:Tfp pilus assembly protein PilV